jgi:hypothetical protein
VAQLAQLYIYTYYITIIALFFFAFDCANSYFYTGTLTHLIGTNSCLLSNYSYSCLTSVINIYPFFSLSPPSAPLWLAHFFLNFTLFCPLHYLPLPVLRDASVSLFSGNLVGGISPEKDRSWQTPAPTRTKNHSGKHEKRTRPKTRQGRRVCRCIAWYCLRKASLIYTENICLFDR